jgi:hypothetical protein
LRKEGSQVLKTSGTTGHLPSPQIEKQLATMSADCGKDALGERRRCEFRLRLLKTYRFHASRRHKELSTLLLNHS